MPSRNWHQKSKLGCVQCKRRRVKCDESRPSCGSCLRTSAECSYAVDANSGPATSLPTHPSQYQFHPLASEHTFQKRWHEKSRSGCFMCRQRRIKCDGALTVCEQCARANLVCVYPTRKQTDMDLDLWSTSKASIPNKLSVATLLNPAETTAFEYFHLNVLPVFRTCQPSTLWTYTLGYSAQTNNTLRRIAIALGFQQRRLEVDISKDDIASAVVNERANVFYGKAIQSLRQTLSDMPSADMPVVALCCVLLIVLECLRGSLKDLLLHLYNGIRITTQAAQDGKTKSIDELYDLAALLQQLGVNAWMYGVSPGYTGDYAMILQNIEFDRLSILSLPTQQTPSALDIHTLLSKIIHTIRQMMGSTDLHIKASMFAELRRLQVRAKYLQDNMQPDESKNPGRGFLAAKLVMADSFLSATLNTQTNWEADRKRFCKVLDLLQDSLVGLDSTRNRDLNPTGRYPFTIGTGAIQMLQSILTIGQTKADPVLEKRALELLKICPPREGLWRTETILQSYYAAKSGVGRDSIVQRRAIAVDEEDKLLTTEDAIDLAQRMRANLNIED